MAEQNWWQRLSGGLKRTSAAITGAISDLASKRKLDAAMLEEIEEVLIRADLGVDLSAKIAAAIGEGRYDKTITADEVKAVLAAEVEKVLLPVAKPLVVGAAAAVHHPGGRRQRLGQDHHHRQAGGALSRRGPQGDARRRRHLPGRRHRAAQDLGRARACARHRAGRRAPMPAGLVFEAFETARREGADVLLVDTAGRLQNKAVLMEELHKMVRVMKKIDPAAPHAVLLVLDATVGQNALSQVEVFHKIAGVTGLAMTKLDGTARGGILAAIAAKHALPVHFIGVGEGIDDLAPFAAEGFRARHRGDRVLTAAAGRRPPRS